MTPFFLDFGVHRLPHARVGQAAVSVCGRFYRGSRNAGFGDRTERTGVRWQAFGKLAPSDCSRAGWKHWVPII